MKVYKAETEEIIRRFLARRITFPACIAALDAALAGLIPHLEGCQIPELRTIMMENNEAVMNEMSRRAAMWFDLEYTGRQRQRKRKPGPQTLKIGSKIARVKAKARNVTPFPGHRVGALRQAQQTTDENVQCQMNTSGRSDPREDSNYT